MEIKQQSNKKSDNKRQKDFLAKKQTGKHSNTQQKRTDSNRMITVDTVEKSQKIAVLPKYAANDWLTYDRTGKLPLI